MNASQRKLKKKIIQIQQKQFNKNCNRINSDAIPLEKIDHGNNKNSDNDDDDNDDDYIFRLQRLLKLDDI